MTLGQPCILDIATYTDGTYRNVVLRHNCVTPKFYCHAQHLECVPTQHIGEPCASAQECRSVKRLEHYLPNAWAEVTHFSLIAVRKERALILPARGSTLRRGSSS